MLRPVNGHLLIEPVKHGGFISSQRETYEEIGIVIDAGSDSSNTPDFPSQGDRVFFDSWLAAKYPKEGTDGEFYWLVKWEDVRGIERNVESTVSE